MGRMLHRLLPEEPGVTGLLALMLLAQARGVTRVADDGRLVLLADQDRDPRRRRGGPARPGAPARGPDVATYPYLSSTGADLLRRLEEWDEAEVAYAEAVALAGNDVERAFLSSRLDEVRARLGP